MIGEPAPTPLPQRVIRVFISSTFRDMQAERDELAKRIFPELRKLCESRGVTWSEVDLRWGISDEQKAEGKVLLICLAEIHRCRPYFIGLLGERYGWVPNELPTALSRQVPWLAELGGCSVTELEIMHGVLHNPAIAEHAFFYFRDPSYIDSLPPERQAAFREVPAPEEIEELGVEESARRAQGRKGKLASLKSRIRRSGLAVRENYRDPRALGELVRDDFTQLIERLFPGGEPPNPLDREAGEHEAFAGKRRGVYIGRKKYFDRLDEQARSDAPPLVVLGESGGGKSALLANWAMRYRAACPDEFLLMHFLGATPASADWAAMVRRILGEFNRRFALKFECSDKPDALRATFANALHMVATRGRVVLILDGLNQLEDRDQAPDLVWLPPVLPPKVRLIVSTLPGRPLDVLNKRGWSRLQIEPLNPDERRRCMADYLAQYTHALSPSLMQRIAGAAQTANPLYLRALLEELLLWGEHETLPECIGHYLSARTVPDLYEKILNRYEQDYDRERPGLVRDAMSLLWAARRGLSEAELMDLLGGDGQPLPRACTTPLYLAAEPCLVSRSGLLGFSHNYVRQAVEERYLPHETERQAAHLRLANYFQTREVDLRQVEELPWQLQQAQSWERLATVLTDPSLFAAAWNRNQFEVKAYWAEVEGKSPERMVDAYRTVMERPGAHPLLVANLLADTGHLEDAFSLSGRLIEHYERAGDRLNLAEAYGNQAVILQVWGRLEEALALLKKQEAICVELNDKDGLQLNYGNQAAILQDWGRLHEGMTLFKKQEAICVELGNKDGLAISYCNQAVILERWGRLEEALALLEKQEAICMQLGNKYGLAHGYGNRALILRFSGRLEEALALHKKEEALCRELGNKNGLRHSYGNQANILCNWGRLEEALALHKKEEALCRELRNKDGLQQSYSNQATILYNWGRLEEALDLLQKQEAICRELENKDGLQFSYGAQANILYSRGRLEEALDLLKKQEAICVELENKNGLQSSYGAKANILYSQGRLEEALDLLKKQEAICLELGNKDGLQFSYGHQSYILYSWGRSEEALDLLRKQEAICAELGNKDGLQTSYNGQAAILASWGRLEEALALLKKEEVICVELGKKDGLRVSYGNQADILQAWGRLPEALALLTKQEAICVELGNRDALQRSYANQADILNESGRLTESLDLLKKQEAICVELENKNGLAANYGKQALILQDWGRLGEALALHKKEEAICVELRNKDGLEVSYGNQASILRAWKRLEESLDLLKKQEAICVELGNKNGLATSYGNQGLILQDWGRSGEALALHKKAEAIHREMCDRVGLTISLMNQASLLAQNLGRPHEGLPLAEEAHRIAKANGLSALVQQIEPILASIRADAASAA